MRICFQPQSSVAIKQNFVWRLVLLSGVLLGSWTSIVQAQPFVPTGSLVYAPVGSALRPMSAPRSGHKATLLQDGKVLIVGGETGFNPTSAEVFDPASGTFSKVGNLNANRTDFTATLLGSGKVLITGGFASVGGLSASCELYDPSTGTFELTGSMTRARAKHTATLLNNGTVLIVGGIGKTTYSSETLSSCEIYDPTTGQFSATGDLLQPRDSHTATLLQSGNVLVAGGSSYDPYFRACEIYNASTGTFSSAGNLQNSRLQPTATLLNNGKVLLTGGVQYTTSVLPTASAELYDPETNSFSLTSAMQAPRANHRAVLLKNGKVLITGGYSYVNNNYSVLTAELYDPASGTFSSANDMTTPRANHTATLLNDGKVLLTGGYSPNSTLSNAELYDPTSGTFTVSGENPARYEHTATRLGNGKVLIVGGLGGSGAMRSAELYDPATGTFSLTGSLITGRYSHTATLLNDGQVLILGGFTNSRQSANAELYDPATGTFSPTVDMARTQPLATATLLPNGKVLVTGGYGYLVGALLYDPATGTFSSTGDMITGRINHTATLLPNGNVLVAGGETYVYSFPNSKFTSTNTAELYNPATGTFTSTSNMKEARAYHTATLLQNGTVLMAGGFDDLSAGNSKKSAEVYNLNMGAFALTGNMRTGHLNHTATLLDNGKVLIAGGAFDDLDAQIYDPKLNGFTGAASMATHRSEHTATLLQNGKVLLVGGRSFDALSSAELYSEPTFVINDVSATEGNSGTKIFTFTVTRNGDISGAARIDYTTTNAFTGTYFGADTKDFIPASGRLSFAAGESQKTIAVVVKGDVIYEGDDGFGLNLLDSTNHDSVVGQGIGTIVNDDRKPSLSINNVTVIEGDNNTPSAVFTISLSSPSSLYAEVYATPVDGTAKSSSDYAIFSSTQGRMQITFAPGETKKNIFIPIFDDVLDEPDENFYVLLSSAYGASIARGRGIGTIKDNDAAPSIDIEDLSIGEGNLNLDGTPGQRVANFKLRLSAPSGKVVKVNYSTANETTQSDDYVAVPATQIAFAAGQTVALAKVIINGDNLNEPDEIFKVNLSTPINATISDAQAFGTILNDDRAPSLSINDVQITEGNSGTKNLVFTVLLSAASSQTVSVNYATTNGTARADSDYLATTNILKFAAGQTSKTISIPINGDTQVEGDETLFVLLSGAVNASIGRARGVGTIKNDDASG